MAQKNNRPKNITLTSPKGTFVFPKLNEPDFGSKDYPVPNGQYVVRLRVKKGDPKVQAFIAKLEAELMKAEVAAKARFAELKVKARKELEEKNGPLGIKPNKLFSVVYDEETEEETGEIEFKFQMPAKVEVKKGPRAGKVLTFKPVICDARGLPIPASKLPPIWGGTVGIISFEFPEGGYFVDGSGMYGLKLRLAGVQIIELKSGGERSVASLGFKQEEGLNSDDLAERDEDEKGDEDENEEADAPTESDF